MDFNVDYSVIEREMTRTEKSWYGRTKEVKVQKLELLVWVTHNKIDSDDLWYFHVGPDKKSVVQVFRKDKDGKDKFDAYDCFYYRIWCPIKDDMLFFVILWDRDQIGGLQEEICSETIKQACESASKYPGYDAKIDETELHNMILNKLRIDKVIMST